MEVFCSLRMVLSRKFVDNFNFFFRWLYSLKMVIFTTFLFTLSHKIRSIDVYNSIYKNLIIYLQYVW